MPKNKNNKPKISLQEFRLVFSRSSHPDILDNPLHTSTDFGSSPFSWSSV